MGKLVYDIALHNLGTVDSKVGTRHTIILSQKIHSWYIFYKYVHVFSPQYMFKNALSTDIGCCAVAQSYPTLCDPWTGVCQASLSSTISQCLLTLMSIESVMPSNLSSSAVLFSSCLQSSPAAGSFPMSWLFASGGQNTEASALASVLPMNNQG